MELDDRTLALTLGRARVVLGLAMCALPGLFARVVLGGSSREVKAALRMVGVRDIALGVGAIICLKERTQDAEWVGMGAVADAGDAVALLLAPGSFRRRLFNAGTAVSGAVSGYALSRRLADARAGGLALAELSAHGRALLSGRRRRTGNVRL